MSAPVHCTAWTGDTASGVACVFSVCVCVCVCVLGESLSPMSMCLFRRDAGTGAQNYSADPVPDPRTVSSVTTVYGTRCALYSKIQA